MSCARRIGSYIVAGVILAGVSTPAHCADAEKVQQAVDRGVKYLKSVDYSLEMHTVGKASLVGLALLECGVPYDDAAVVRAADTVRDASVSLTHTYSVALAIMFLDRLGDPNDVPLIQSLGVRLIAGQNNLGGWSYECPTVDDNEVRRLTSLKEQRRELRGQEKLPAAPKTRPKLPKELNDLLARLEQRRPAVHMGDAWRREDNSNTQFAILGLWIARRHGVPVELPLALVEQRFRKQQNSDGGWPYTTGLPSSAAMTCAGLLGLAVGYGSANEATLRTGAPSDLKRKTKLPAPRNPGRDPAVIAGLNYLSTAIGVPLGEKGIPALGMPRGDGRMYYFFWSLERVAVAYDLRTIGKKNWYAWGSDVLVANQEENGSWAGEFGGAVDTSFALLFLRRANLVADLTASLKGKVKDPGEVTLKAGGVGGEALRNHGKPPAANTDEPPTRPATVATDPPAKKVPPEENSADLSMALVKAAPEQRDEVLDRYKNAKGVAYTEALAFAIPRLPASTQTKARDALAERFMRMNLTTLRARLRDNDPEMRVAAARACAGKDDTIYVPDLIALLDDREPMVIRSARSALKHLARGKDFGPANETNAAERAKAMDQWKEWWKSQPPK